MRELLTFREAGKMPIHRWFHYKEGFSPEFVKRVMEGREGPLLDPFMGSGTTLVAANELCVESYGLDVSELSLFVANEKTREHSDDELEELEEFAKDIKKWREEVEWKFELFPVEKAFPKRNIVPIRRIRAAVESLGKARNLALLALISIIPLTSFVVKEGGVLRIDKRKRVGNTYELYKKAVKKIIEDVRGWEGCHKASPLMGDARNMPFEDGSIATIITSPPYLNNIDYSKVYGLELSLLTLDYNIGKKVRQRLFPSFIQQKGSFGEYREMAANSYFKATERVWEEMERVLARGGLIAYNVSNAVIHGESIAVDEKCKEIAEKLGMRANIEVGFVRKTRIGSRVVSANESVVFAKKD